MPFPQTKADALLQMAETECRHPISDRFPWLKEGARLSEPRFVTSHGIGDVINHYAREPRTPRHSKGVGHVLDLQGRLVWKRS